MERSRSRPRRRRLRRIRWARLSWEKGLRTLLEAWRSDSIPLPLKIIGDGPLRPDVQEAAAHGNVQWLGHRPIEEVMRIIADASCLVFPSIWHETFGRTIIEAFAVGTPVIASLMGSAAELVSDGQTGLHFEPGNADDLARKVRQFVGDRDKQSQMRQAARREFEEQYTPAANYGQLMEIYRRAGRGRAMAALEYASPLRPGPASIRRSTRRRIPRQCAPRHCNQRAEVTHDSPVPS